ncbi:MAG: hypothetical protein ABL869_05030 [Candidatus Nitrotoga sp.]
MNYPEWAPQILVEQHKKRTDNDLPERKFKTQDPETIIADVLQKQGGNMSEENIENIRRTLYRNSLGGLPDKESTALLELLISDLRMKDAWKALAKRVKQGQEFFSFFRACEDGITGWRGDLKQTPSERRAFYQEIWDAAATLQSLMGKSSEFDHYSINRLVDDQQIKWLLDELSGTTDIRYARFCLHDVIPSMFEILNDIATKATQYAEEESSVKKPNSVNAEIHYFTRSLSDYCQGQYNQPLHEVVAITTAVIFDQQNIDTDYVRKIVKR